MVRRVKVLAFLMSVCFALPALAQDTQCPVTDGKMPKVYAIGSSTMGSVLGPVLKNMLKREGVKFDRWGKASSGLARPDFHNWPKLAPGLMLKHKPDVVIVSLGTNDFQNIHKRGKWIKWGTDLWKEVYAARVDKMLTILGGKDKQRLVLWTGPTAFPGKKAQRRAPVVNEIMRERVAAYRAAGGNAVFLDAYAQTSDENGKPLVRAVIKGKRTKIRTPDGIHLKTAAVKALMAVPIVDAMRPCIKVAEVSPK